jgi:hypothetical protein
LQNIRSNLLNIHRDWLNRKSNNESLDHNIFFRLYTGTRGNLKKAEQKLNRLVKRLKLSKYEYERIDITCGYIF